MAISESSGGRAAALLFAAWLALAAPGALAADPPAAAASSGSASGAKLMSRDELRACLQRRDALAASGAELQRRGQGLDDEKAALLAAQKSLDVDRSGLDAQRRAAFDLAARSKSYADRVEAWNQRARAVQDKTDAAADDERAALEKLRPALQSEQEALQAERSRLGSAAAQAVDAFNARAAALDQRVADWNRRNEAFVADTRAADSERGAWSTACSERRYREDDLKSLGKAENLEPPR